MSGLLGIYLDKWVSKPGILQLFVPVSVRLKLRCVSAVPAAGTKRQLDFGKLRLCFKHKLFFDGALNFSIIDSLQSWRPCAAAG